MNDYVKCESCNGTGMMSDSQTGEPQECFDCDGGFVAVTERNELHEAIGRERQYQDRKWGTIEDNPHSVGEYILIMQRELREAADAWSEGRGDAGALEEILQVISVGVACLEQHGIVERPESEFGSYANGYEHKMCRRRAQ